MSTWLNPSIYQLVPKHLNVLHQLDLPPLCYFSLSGACQSTGHGGISIFTIKIEWLPSNSFFYPCSSPFAGLVASWNLKDSIIYKGLNLAYFAAVKAFLLFLNVSYLSHGNQNFTMHDHISGRERISLALLL